MYRKLVRDRIPELIRRNGGEPRTRRLSVEEFTLALARKLIEEADEFATTPTTEELADVLEVVHALARQSGLSLDELEALRRAKAAERGAFGERLLLESVSYPGDPSGEGPVNLRDAWEAEARNWVAWARKPGHDSYWQFHRDRFLELLPPASGLTLDIGCGEGRFPRDLKARGYEVIGVDASPTLIDHARDADPDGDYRLADAASLPLADASVQLVTGMLSLHDMDDMEGAIGEAARVLVPGGRLCAAIVHPVNSAGKFQARLPDAAFVIRGSYFEQRHFADTIERDGLRMTFTSRHRPLGAYFGALEAAGLLVERLVEVPDGTHEPGDRWQRLPLFLHFRAVKPA